MAADDKTVSVAGRRIRLTSLDKVMYPATGTTKAEVIGYVSAVAGALIPHIADRPVTRKRWVHGVGTEAKPGQVFFQKNLDESTPEWVARRMIAHKDHDNDYPLVNELATLVWLAQLGSLELHVPQWRFGRTGARRNPDRLVLDLDPGPGAGLTECAEVARIARELLQGMGLDPLPVTSGSKGIHLYAALDGKLSSKQVSEVAKELARAIEADHPQLAVSDMKKALREGRVLVDWSQNNENKTTVAPYSLRGRLRPTVAAPRSWEELDDPGLTQLEFPEVAERLQADGDLLAPLLAGRFASLEPTPERIAGFEPSASGADRLARYRSMRDAAKTPEPVPPDAPAASEGASFVIQEHHARRTHWDFRLERDGVLVSWALPKGVPADPATNHLAVQTEDHPLEYGAFEGEIPAGQYGAGTVTIWDSGIYELEKWREGQEVIVTLHGQRHGTNKYALIRTGRDGGKQQWLIHLMAQNGRQPKPRALPRPMLASSATELELAEPEEWAFEMKWDGIRAIASLRHGQVRLVSRNGIEQTATYPELAELAEALAQDAVVDGEIVALNRSGRPDFGRLQQRMGLSRPAEVETAAQQVPVQFMLFDVLEFEGEKVTSSPWRQRRRMLEQLVTQTAIIKLPPVFDGDLEGALATSRELGLEGVMAKRADSRYLMGRRSRQWLKLKHLRTQEVVVGGWRPGSGRRSGVVGSLLLGVPASGKLDYLGRVGTGFTDAELERITARLEKLASDRNPFHELPAADARDARFVRPRLVAEVEFQEWTGSGRLRQASWRGWRPDKKPAEVVREE